MIPRLLITAALALGVLLATTGGASSQPMDPASVVHAYIRAVNAHNVDAVLALYADDAVHEVMPPPPGATGVYIGKAQIRQFYQQTAANHDHLAVVGTLRVVGNKVSTPSGLPVTVFGGWASRRPWMPSLSPWCGRADSRPTRLCSPPPRSPSSRPLSPLRA